MLQGREGLNLDWRRCGWFSRELRLTGEAAAVKAAHGSVAIVIPGLPEFPPENEGCMSDGYFLSHGPGHE